MMLILSLGFLACLILKEILCILCFTLFFLVYLDYRFKDKRIWILFILFSLLSCILVYPKEVQQQDTYKITEKNSKRRELNEKYIKMDNKLIKMFIEEIDSRKEDK